MGFSLGEIIDAQELQSMLDEFHAFTKLPMFVVDLEGNVLAGVGWQDICTQFHRVHPETRKYCIESDTQLSKGVPEGTFKIYKCQNNMWDIATPIVVKKNYVGNVFMGQLFFEDEVIDYEFFRAQARKYGFDEEEYIAALNRVPRYSRETAYKVMKFYARIAKYISAQGLRNVKLNQVLQEHEQKEELLKEKEEELGVIYENAPIVMMLIDEDCRVRKINGYVSFLLNKLPEEIVGSTVCEALNCPHKTSCETCIPKIIIMNTFKSGLGRHQVEAAHPILVDGQEKEFYFLISTKKVNIKEKPMVLVSLQDITERKQIEKKVRSLSFTDYLTGLYNRAYLDEEMKRLDTKRQLPISIIMADLNGLKLVNDTYGHLTGDTMLKRAAEILKSSCREEDIIARWGGDEFIILLPQTSEEDIKSICKRIENRCSETYVEDIPVSVSLGTATKNDIQEDLTGKLIEAENDMYKSQVKGERSARSAVLDTFYQVLEEKSFETEKHINRMLEAAYQIAKAVKLPESELRRLRLLISFHDIGKINISEDILKKDGVLTAEEWELIKRHPETGYRIALAAEEFAHIANDILSHHERWDGSGYPRGLSGKDIPLLARITAIADAYEVMSQGRPYKKPLSHEEIVKEFKKCSGRQFDPELVDIFLQTL